MTFFSRVNGAERKFGTDGCKVMINKYNLLLIYVVLSYFFEVLVL